MSSILKGESAYVIEKKSKAFFEEYYPSIIRENALEFIEKIDRTNTESFIVSASLDIWLKPFADKFGFGLISTKAKFENEIFTGNFDGKNCNKQEKVIRIKERLKDRKFDKIIAFGDTSGDKAMFKFANESHYRFFH